MPESAAIEPRSIEFVRTDALPIRLAAFEGKPGLIIEDCRGGKRWLEAEGSAVRSSSGERAKSFEFEPENAIRGLQLGDRRYRGKLRVEVRAAGGLRVTNIVPLEDYVEGVVAGEVVLWSAEPAELEAQAIAARTYALISLTRRPLERFLWDDTRDQAYRGIFLPSNDGETKVAGKLARAIEASSGLVLRRDGALYDSRFHASCGGHTAMLGDVFPAESVVFAGAVPCAACRTIGTAERARGETRGKVAWQAHFDSPRLGQLARELRVGEHLQSIRVARMDSYGRWLAVECRGELGARTIEWNEMRRLLDAGVLKSGLILGLVPSGGALTTGGMTIEGVGRGHGVGLCQVGAHALAAEGRSATQILAHYYPLAQIETLPDYSLAAAE